MRGKSLALLVLALGCGLVASIGVTQVISKRNTDAPTSSVETQSIFVALDDIALGEPLTAQVLKLEPWPKGKIPEGAFTKIEDVEGRRTRTRLFAGEPIIERKLLKQGEFSGGVSPLIPKGLRVVSVKVDRVSGTGGLILPGDRVDVVIYLAATRNQGVSEPTTRTVLQDIKVFAVNDQFHLDAEETDQRSIPNAQTVSLLVTPLQAQKVMLAGEMGQIRLVLRSPEDDEQTTVATATAQDILGGAGASIRNKESLLEPEPQANDAEMQGFLEFLNQNKQANTGPEGAAPGPQPVASTPENTTWNMRIVRAGRVEDVNLHEHSKPSGQGSTWRQGGAASAGSAGAPFGPSPPVPGPNETAPAETGPNETGPALGPPPEASDTEASPVEADDPEPELE